MGKTWLRQHPKALRSRSRNLHYLDLLHLCHERVARRLSSHAPIPIHLDRHGDSSNNDAQATCI